MWILEGKICHCVVRAGRERKEIHSQQTHPQLKIPDILSILVVVPESFQWYLYRRICVFDSEQLQWNHFKILLLTMKYQPPEFVGWGVGPRESRCDMCHVISSSPPGKSVKTNGRRLYWLRGHFLYLYFISPLSFHRINYYLFFKR